MNLISSVRLLASSVLLTSFFVSNSNASEGTCSDKWGRYCTPPAIECGSPGTVPCVITISDDGHLATATQQGAHVPDARICIRAGTEVRWVEMLQSNGSFTVSFPATHPFHSKQIFRGTSGAPDTDEIPSTGKRVKGCYKYAIGHCNNGRCLQNDPKVIVKGGGGGPQP
jgi:hypothetical protein